MYSVVYSKNAAKMFQKLDRRTAFIIYNWIDKNLRDCENPRLHGKALAGNKKGYWRYRVGAYRIIAEIQDNTIRIEIINVAHRRDVYEDY
ncbi:MAG: type II toxin-antitoxin system RelE/ParE family toxin [Oscillospiraceae bacterium]|jgi:mRNA interferase RelE/StbE|nr:type II toxin-antitoxin system RelE/ParE family toxin [Oscillospiraceae bacterium]